MYFEYSYQRTRQPKVSTEPLELSTSDNIIRFPTVRSGRSLSAGAVIAPAVDLPDQGDGIVTAAGEHTSEPIKDINTINRICEYLLENERYRDYLLFVVGINFGLRVSDLLRLRWCDIIEDDLMTFKESFYILEKKTSKTRKRAKNRYVVINEAVMDAACIYLQHTDGVKLNDFLFHCEDSRGKNHCTDSNKALDRSTVDRMLKGIANNLALKEKISTHSLRKTFGYHQMVMSGNNPRKLILLQKIFGHSSVEQTLDYIGVTREEIEDAYNELNLGLGTAYPVCRIVEDDKLVKVNEVNEVNAPTMVV